MDEYSARDEGGQMITVDFDFDIAELVTIIAIGMQGRIDSMSNDINGKMYRVVYWNDSQRYSVWMYRWEIM